MKNLIIIILSFITITSYSQTLASNNLPKGQVITDSRNGKEEVNIWSLKEDRWLYFNDKIYPFTKDSKASSLTKIVGWVTISNSQYRVVLFIEVTSIEISNPQGQRVNSFN